MSLEGVEKEWEAIIKYGYGNDSVAAFARARIPLLFKHLRETEALLDLVLKDKFDLGTEILLVKMENDHYKDCIAQLEQELLIFVELKIPVPSEIWIQMQKRGLAILNQSL